MTSILVRELDDAQLESPLGRASPVLKLAIAIGWFIGLAFTLDPRPPAVILVVALVAGLGLGRIRPTALARAVLPLWAAAASIGIFNALFAGVNGDPLATEIGRLGPFRITEPALAAGFGLAVRVLAITGVGAVFGLTTDPTRLADSLVQQARVPERFAYGALAAYGAIPRFAADLVTIRQARRIRGLRAGWHPRILVGLLVLAIRHGDRLALAMDARGFGSGQRTRYRVVTWSHLDLVFATAAVVVLGLAFAARG